MTLYENIFIVFFFTWCVCVCVCVYIPSRVHLYGCNQNAYKNKYYLQIMQTLLSAQPHWRYLMQTHTPTHTHDSNNFPPPAACCGSWSAASVNWLSGEEEREKEEGAAGHEQQRRWRPIGNQRTMSISAPHGQNTRSDSCHSPLQPGPLQTERENVSDHTVRRLLLGTSHWFHQLDAVRPRFILQEQNRERTH